ncbi:hypothetical protein Patl1_33543 [Pistacia atlantica]|uniref:Uncharacterized protein n=1 Tax=Pistacia atlantica TaxID=434234 RepID=A0ACC0ZVH2_9ROSI|nr:hypothetical protein Patl1_33543 [Pistacia atlantica]
MTHSCFRLCQVVSELFSILVWQTAETKKHSLMKMIIECRPFGKQSVLKRRDPSFNFENSMMQSLTLQLFKVMMVEGIITLWVVTNIDMSTRTTDGSDDEPMLYRNAGQNGGNMRRHNRQVQDLHGCRLRVNYAVDRARSGGLEVQVVMEVETTMEVEEITPVVLVVEKLDMVLVVVVVMLKVYKMEILGSETFQMETVLTMEILEVLAVMVSMFLLVVVAVMVGFIGYSWVTSRRSDVVYFDEDPFQKGMKSYALKTATA